MMFAVHILLLAIAGGCLAQYDDGFPDSLKTAAFEEIIGNYYAFDPFLQTGRKGRELNGHPDEFEFASFQPTFDSSPSTDSNDDDNTFYSIPPAFTAPESKDQPEFVEAPVSVTTRPSVHHHVRQLNDLQSNSPFKFESEFNNFDNENYAQYPPYLTEQSVTQQQQQLSADVTRESQSLPDYVIGVAGEEATDENDFFQTTKRRSPARRQSVHRDQFVRRARPALQLDESPFAKRALRYVHSDDVPAPRYNRARSSDLTQRRRANHDLPYDRNIRNGYYVASKVLWRTPVPVDRQRSRYSVSSGPPVYAD